MCGIFGFQLRRPLTPDDIILGRQGIAGLRHRGPDGEGEWFDVSSGVFLGHTRLAIIDTTHASDQPFVRGPEGMVFNGEIYNYKEVRSDLAARGHVFVTSGDTEVLFTAWKEWGAGFTPWVDGMFAVVFRDRSGLHCWTDPFGEKPLYWVETKDGFYFSSEPDPLVVLLGLTFDPTPRDEADFIVCGFFPDDKTGYVGLHRMRPGSWLTFSLERGLQQGRYWTPAQPPLIRSDRLLQESDVDHIAGLLVESLKVRLRADVPLGLFLSSGVDSSLIAALAVKELNCRLKSLTVSFPNEDVQDEVQSAARIADYLGLEHQIIPSVEDPFRKYPLGLLQMLGEPNDNLTGGAVYQMSLAARPNLKVALTGIGGDEMFYGYNKYHQLYRQRQWIGHLSGAHGAMLLARLYNWAPKKYIPAALAAMLPPQAVILGVKNNFAAGWLWEQLKIRPSLMLPYKHRLEEAWERARYFDLDQTLPNSYIVATERGSMRAALEMRTPFLNRKLYQALWHLPQEALIATGTKSLLRRILRRYLPVDICGTPKKGFNYPMGRFINSFGLAQPSSSIMNNTAIQEMWALRRNPGWKKLALRTLILDRFRVLGLLTKSSCG